MNNQLFAVSRDKKLAKKVSQQEQLQAEEKMRLQRAQDDEDMEIAYARLGFNELVER